MIECTRCFAVMCNPPPRRGAVTGALKCIRTGRLWGGSPGGDSTCSACSRRLLSSSLDVSVRGRGRGVTAAEMRTVPSTQGQHGHDPHRPSAGHPRPGSRDPRTAIAVSGIARSRTRICVARSFDSSNPYFVIILVYVGAQETGRAFVLRFSPYPR